MSDSGWYSLLTEAQDYWVKVVAQHAPDLLAAAPVTLSTADSGLTYTFATEPLFVIEITTGQGGRALRNGAYNDPQAEFVWEGTSKIRMARASARTFTSGLYARQISQPTDITAGIQPVIPTMFRPLLVPRAVYYYAVRGGYRDPQPYMVMEQKLWSGDPTVAGDTGLLGLVKKRQSQQIMHTGNTPWWQATGDLG